MRPIRDSPKPPSRKVACRQCRQAKTRCALHRIPCPRCHRLGLACSIEPSYKRTNKQDRVEELQRHLLSLQGVIDQHLPSQGTSSQPYPDTTLADSTSRSAADGPGDEHESVSRSTPDTSPLQHSSVRSVGREFVYTLGSVTITAERAQILFST